MLKLTLLRLFFAVACLGIELSCFAQELHPALKEWQNESLTHLSNGTINLLSHEPWHALENFQKASTLLDMSDHSSLIINFLIFFGQAVAYDCLGFHEQCKQAIGSLFFSINGYDSDVSTTDGQYIDSNSHEYASSVQFLRNLAAIAPSYEVRELLFSIIDEIANELLPSFEFAKSPCLGNGDWVFDYGTEDVSITQCKSLWKKFKKWCHEIGELLRLIEKATDAAKGIKRNIDELHRSNQYNDPRNLTPDYIIN